MAQDLHTGTATIALMVSAYLITVAIFIPLSGWMANQFGKKEFGLLL